MAPSPRLHQELIVGLIALKIILKTTTVTINASADPGSILGGYSPDTICLMVQCSWIKLIGAPPSS